MELIKTGETELPKVARGGRQQSEESKQIIEALKTGEVHKIENVEPGNVYNALQQRIRSAAKAAGLSVKIRYIKETQEVKFSGGILV